LGCQALQRAQQLLVGRQVDVVRNRVVVADFDEGVAAHGFGRFDQGVDLRSGGMLSLSSLMGTAR
jgi:hypothetical protein